MMLTHDPFQNLQTLAGYSGIPAQYGLPITAFQPYNQPSFNPAAIANQPQPSPGFGGYGMFPPQSLQAGIGQQNPLQQLATWNPLTSLLLNPAIQNHLLQQYQLAQQSPWQQNPMAAATQQNPFANPLLAYYAWNQQQQQLQQQQPQFQSNYPLAPQSMIGGPAGIGQQPFSQIHPLALAALQAAAFRPPTTYGFQSGVGF
jgi:hypothetical protein